MGDVQSASARPDSIAVQAVDDEGPPSLVLSAAFAGTEPLPGLSRALAVSPFS